MPPDASEMYDTILRQQSSQPGVSTQLQMLILQWAAYSKRALRLSELVSVISHVHGHLLVQEESKSVVRSACGPLLEFSPSDIIEPIHQSVKDWIISEKDPDTRLGYAASDSNSIEESLARQCITYLLDVFDPRENQVPISLDEMKGKYTFLDYALKYWAFHSKGSAQDADSLLPLLDRFLDDENSRAGVVWKNTQLDLTWVRPGFGFTSRTYLSDEDYKFARCIRPLHVASTSGLAGYIDVLVQRGAPLEEHGWQLFTALHFAARAAQVEAVQMLIRHGAAIDSTDDEGNTPLHLTARNSHGTECAKALLMAGASPLTPRAVVEVQPRYINTRSGIHVRPVDIVGVARHRLGTLKAFLPYIGPEDVTLLLCDALWRSKAEDRDRCLFLATNPKLDVNFRSGTHTALFLAATFWQADCVEVLLKRGADAKALSNLEYDSMHYRPLKVTSGWHSSTPLHGFGHGASILPRMIAPERSNEEADRIVKLLVDAGCEINALDGDGKTALSYAQRSAATVSALVRHGASVSAVLADGSYPLHHNASCGPDYNIAACVRWMELGFGLDSRDDRGRTPLLTLFAGFQRQTPVSMAKWLIEQGSDVRAVDQNGNNACHLIIQIGRPWTLELLNIMIDAGVDSDAKNKAGDTPIQVAGRAPNKAGFERLLRLSKNLESRNCRGETAFLTHAKSTGGHGSLHDLVESGCDVHARDKRGANALHIAVENSASKWVIEEILKVGVSEEASDLSGDTIWHYSLKIGYQKICEGLPDGVLGKKNHFSQSPLHYFVATGCSFNLVDEKALIERLKTIDPDGQDEHGVAPIHIAAATSIQSVYFVLRLGADAWAKTRSQQTVLHFAAQARKPEMLAFLTVQAQADGEVGLIDAEDAQGWSALAYAMASGRFESVKILLDAGASVTGGIGSHPLTPCEAHLKEKQLWRDERDPRYDTLLEMVDIAISALHQPDFRLLARRLGSISNDLRDFRSYRSNKAGEKWYHKRTAERPPSTRQVATHVVRAWHQQSHQGPVSINQTLLLDQLSGSGHEALAGVMFGGNRPSPVVTTRLGRSSMLNPTEDLRLDIPEPICTHLKDLIENDQEDEIHSTLECIVESSTFMKSLSTVKQVMRLLINAGRQEALAEFAPRVRSKIGETRSVAAWPKSLASWNGYRYNRYAEQYEAEPGTVGDSMDYESVLSWRCLYEYQPSTAFRSEESNFTLGYETESSPLDGALLYACEGDMCNLEVVRALIEGVGYGEMEMTHALFQLAKAKHFWHTEALEYVLSKVRDVNARNPVGRTALHITCSSEQLFSFRAVEILLKGGVDPNITDKQNLTCLNFASWNVDMMRLLIEHGAKIALGNPRCLISVLKAQNIHGLKLLLEHGADINARAPSDRTVEEQARSRLMMARPPPGSSFAPDSDDEDYLVCSYPLHYAALKRYKKVIEDMMDFRERRAAVVACLLDAGADPFAILEDGSVLIFELLASGADIKLMLARPGSKVAIRDGEGRTVLLAFLHRQANMMKRGVSPAEYLSLLSQVLTLERDLMAVDNAGRHALHYLTPPFTLFGNKVPLDQILNKLLERQEINGLVNLKDSAGALPIHAVAQVCDWVTTRQLITQGGAVLEPDLQGNTVLHHFVRELGQLAIGTSGGPQEPKSVASSINFLKSEHGLDVNALNHDGQPALFVYLRRCPYLKHEWPVDGWVDLPDEGERFSFFEGLKMLINDAGLDPRVRSSNGQSALHILGSCSVDESRKSRMYEPQEGDGVRLVEAWMFFVKEIGLDPREEDAHGVTSLDLAGLTRNAMTLVSYKA